MNFYFGMGGTPISLRQKLRMQRERMQCAGLWPVVLNVLNNYNNSQNNPPHLSMKKKDSGKIHESDGILFFQAL